MEQKNPNIEVTQEVSLSEILQVRRDKLKSLQEKGQNPYAKTKFNVTSYAQTEVDNFDDEAEEHNTISLAGRIMSKRIMGKAAFMDLRDTSGKIQLYLRQDALGVDYFKEVCTWDIGDIAGVTGEVFRTKHGEVSVRVKSIELLSKSLLPLPEKFHGLKDQDMRYRQREVDLIVNPEVKGTFVKRSLILRALREFLDNRGFLEVDTPILTPLEIGASARPFYTHHNTLDMDMVLRIETELYLKRLIVGGFDKVYEVGRIFRNEGMDTKHNPEFTSIELYQAYTDYNGMMDLVEDMMKTVTQKVCGTLQIPYDGKIIDLSHWERMTMTEAVKKYSGVDFDQISSDEEAIAISKQHNVELPEVPSKGAILSEFFDAFVEENLIQPTFIYDYPVEISPLAKRKPENPMMTERFEYFINATEFGNAFSELNDPIDQRARFEKQVADRRELDPTTKAQVDYDYVTALEYGLAPTGGLGFGVDRLVMLLTDSASIRDVLLFPTMKPVAKTETANNQRNMDNSFMAKAVSAVKEVVSDVVEEVKEEIEEFKEEIKEEINEKIDFSNVEIEPLFTDFVDFETFAKSDFRAVKVKECEAVPKSKKLLKFTLDDGTDTDRVILSGIHEYYEPETLIGKTLIAITNLPPRKMMGIDSCGMIISAVHHEEGVEKLNLLMVDKRIPAGAKLY